jgi:hypothetical protein
LRLKETEDRLGATQAGALQLAAADGQLIQRWSRSDRTTLETLGPSKSRAIAAAIEFPSDLKYPYTFSMLAANMEHGLEGEGHFAIQIFT